MAFRVSAGRAAGLAGSFVLSAAAPAIAQESGPPVAYEVSFENAVHHEARISLALRDLGDAPLELVMSRSSPGRYAIHEFAKNVYDVSAVDGAGRDLAVTRRDPYSWTVAGHDGAATVAYTLYADRADGTYSQIDETHAHLNAPATFMWARGLEERPVSVRFDVGGRDWKAATQLEPARGRLAFAAPDLQYFLDSPVELSDFDLREWRVEHKGERATIRLAVHHDGSQEDVDLYAQKARNVVAEQIRLFDDIPDFDFGTYTFIADYLPHVSGDGMEHRNSTILTSSQSLYEADFGQLGTLSHEFIHAWNVERLRPAELEPFDFTRANPTPSLWFAEGFTSYYGPLAIRRAGESSTADYLSSLGALVSAILDAPGRAYAPPTRMSLRAPFVDAATAIDPDNHANIFVSYYGYGAVIALALDLELRARFEDVTLDDYMRRLWAGHGISQTPYTTDDLRAALAAVTGDDAFASTFFDSYIEASALPDFTPLFERAGLVLRARNPGAASIGRASYKEDGGRLVIESNTRTGDPLYKAGLDRGDEIVRIGRIAIDSEDDIERALARHEPGETATVRFIARSGEREADLVFAEDPTLELVLFENAGREPSPAQRAFRESWLGGEE